MYHYYYATKHYILTNIILKAYSGYKMIMANFIQPMSSQCQVVFVVKRESFSRIPHKIGLNSLIHN